MVLSFYWYNVTVNLFDLIAHNGRYYKMSRKAYSKYICSWL